MNRSQLLDTEQHIKKGVGGGEDNISGEIKGKDGSVTTYNPIHPPEDQQRIKGTSTVLGEDNMERETRDRDPVPTTTKMSTNRTPIHAASSPTFPDQEQKPKTGALRQEEDDQKRKDHHPLKEQRQNNFLGRENSTDKNDNKYATSNSLDSPELKNIPEGVPIDKVGEVPPTVNLALVIQPPTSDEKKNEPAVDQTQQFQKWF